MHRAAPHHLLGALAVALATWGCSPAGARSPAPERSQLAFENLTVDAVHVYLVGEGENQLLGWVEPSGRAMLDVPRQIVFSGNSYRVLAIRAGAPNPRGLPINAPALGTQSYALPITDLLRLRWQLMNSGIRPRLRR